jgi:pimeloyl-ACP methyl ester carboxylesterase
MTRPSAFKSSEGEAAYLSAYDAAMKAWPVPYEAMDISSRFGVTHVVTSGPRNAPSLVLLHGYWATLTMWTPNISEFSRSHRVYAIDVMGQPGKSVPGEPIRNAADCVAWLAAVLDALHLDRISLAGMSFGGWLALNYAAAAPERVQSLVLLSPAASVLGIVKQFALRGTLMMLLPTRFTVNGFMRWLGFKDDPDDFIARDTMTRVIDLMYLGLKHFRFPRETSRIMPTVFSDSDLRAMQVPTLLLMGDHEVIYDPANALSRARRLIPDLEGELVRGSSHEMTVRQHRIVDARVVDFLKRHESQHTIKLSLNGDITTIQPEPSTRR